MFRPFFIYLGVAVALLAGPTKAATIPPDFSVDDLTLEPLPKDDLYTVLIEHSATSIIAHTPATKQANILGQFAFVYSLTVASIVIARKIPAPRRSPL